MFAGVAGTVVGVDVGTGVFVGMGGTGVGVKPAWTIKVGASAADSPMLNKIAKTKTRNNRLDCFEK